LADHRYYSTHEQLQEKAHEKDIQIQNLLRQFDQLRTEQKIRHWVEKAHDPGMFVVLAGSPLLNSNRTRSTG
jgi:hypothetical protein